MNRPCELSPLFATVIVVFPADALAKSEVYSFTITEVETVRGPSIPRWAYRKELKKEK